jgi:hypothetical protein
MPEKRLGNVTPPGPEVVATSSEDDVVRMCRSFLMMEGNDALV